MKIILGAIKMKGDPFFTQLRPGKDEKIFKLIKRIHIKDGTLSTNSVEKSFDVGTHLRFEPTIIGAITTYFFASFPNCRGYSLISNKDTDRSWWLGRTFGEALSANVPIPWGLRIEVLSKGHYIVSCLGFSYWDLVDHNVEVRDRQALIHHGFYY